MPTFVLNRRVASEVFEDECIIANLDTGLYYSLQGNAVALIGGLPSNDAESLIDTIVKPLAAQAQTCKEELQKIWQRLLDEELVITSTSEPAIPAVINPATEYKISAFNRYSDMQDLLLLDPIHEVDEDGWEKKE